MLSTFSVLWLVISCLPSELHTESLLAFLLDDLSGIFVRDFSKNLVLFNKLKKLGSFDVYWFSKRRKQNCFAIEIINFSTQINSNFTSIYTFRTREAGKIRDTFTPRSVRRPSKAEKQEVQFRFVDLRLSDCSCLPGKASVHFLSELRLRFASPPIPAFSWRRSWTWQWKLGWLINYSWWKKSQTLTMTLIIYR